LVRSPAGPEPGSALRLLRGAVWMRADRGDDPQRAEGRLCEMKFLFVLALLLVPLSARAATDDEIFAVYAHGDYEQAARLGEAARAAPALAPPAGAVLAEDVLRESPCLACLERAESLARQAVA